MVPRIASGWIWIVGTLIILGCSYSTALHTGGRISPRQFDDEFSRNSQYTEERRPNYHIHSQLPASPSNFPYGDRPEYASQEAESNGNPGFVNGNGPPQGFPSFAEVANYFQDSPAPIGNNQFAQGGNSDPSARPYSLPQGEASPYQFAPEGGPASGNSYVESANPPSPQQYLPFISESNRDYIQEPQHLPELSRRDKRIPEHDFMFRRPPFLKKPKKGYREDHYMSTIFHPPPHSHPSETHDHDHPRPKKHPKRRRPVKHNPHEGHHQHHPPPPPPHVEEHEHNPFSPQHPPFGDDIRDNHIIEHPHHPHNQQPQHLPEPHYNHEPYHHHEQPPLGYQHPQHPTGPPGGPAYRPVDEHRNRLPYSPKRPILLKVSKLKNYNKPWYQSAPQQQPHHFRHPTQNSYAPPPYSEEHNYVEPPNFSFTPESHQFNENIEQHLGYGHGGEPNVLSFPQYGENPSLSLVEGNYSAPGAPSIYSETPIEYTPPSKLPPPPPVFYAPSPDVALRQKKKYQEGHQGYPNPHHHDHQHQFHSPREPQPQLIIGHNGIEPAFHGEEEGYEGSPHYTHQKRENVGQHEHTRKNPRRRIRKGNNNPRSFTPSQNDPRNQHESSRHYNDNQNHDIRVVVPEDTVKSPKPNNNDNNDKQTERNTQSQEQQGSSRTTLLRTRTNTNTQSATVAQEEDGRKLSRKKRELKDPMVADGSEDIFWERPSPYIIFDRYKKPGEESHELQSLARSSSSYNNNNVSFHDHDSQEQRFFPSFPAPFLSGLNPFAAGGLNALTSARAAPLFPGPVVNRAPPSRYHASSPFKFATAPNLANRGPSSAASHHDRYYDNNLLGSGNFEVVRGGTYYADEDEGPATYGGSPYEDDDYYGHNNAHSSPYRGGGGGDFFANFRDFADINPHSSRSYSHHHETRVPSSSSKSSKSINNIFDKLNLEEGEHLETASSGDHHQPQFSLDYDPLMATF